MTITTLLVLTVIWLALVLIFVAGWITWQVMKKMIEADDKWLKEHDDIRKEKKDGYYPHDIL